jgi:hypothetical protein
MSYFIYKKKACYYEEYGNGTPAAVTTRQHCFFQDVFRMLLNPLQQILK